MTAAILCGDFRRLAAQLPDDSVQLIITDPPPGLHGPTARLAARILKPGGSLIAYCDQSRLPADLEAGRAHLRYWWFLAHLNKDRSRANDDRLCSVWTPLIWYVKGTRGDTQRILNDTRSGDREAVANYYIERLTVPHGLVVDFFAADATTLIAAQKLGRRGIGFDIDASAVDRARARLEVAA